MKTRIPPRWPICPTLVRAWLRELDRRPLEEWEVGPARGPWQIWEVGPARDPRDINQDPELAFALAPDGIPVWWPARHPATLERLTREIRRNWFVYWLTEELSARRSQLRRGARSYWRRVIAQVLLLTHAEGEPWTIPYPLELEGSYRG